MLTAVNAKTKMVQEILGTAQGELLSAERPAQVAFVDGATPVPTTGPCRCLGLIVFADDLTAARIRIMDSGVGVPIMEVFANAGWWGSFVFPRGVASTGNLVANITGSNAYGYVYYVVE